MNNYRTLTAVSALIFVAVGISSPLITIYLESLGASYAQISLILTTYVAVLIAGNYLWGRIADRLGKRKPLLLIGLIAVSVGYYLLSRADDPTLAWGARLIEAAGMASITTISLALMGDILEDATQKGRRMGLYRGIGSLAFSLGALTGGRVADSYSLSLTFAICALIYLGAAVVSLLLHDIPMPPKSTDQSATPPLKRRWRLSGDLPILFLAGALLWTASHSASTSMWPNYMSSLGYTNTAIGSLWGLAAFIEMPAMYIAGALSDVMGRAILLAAGGFFIAIVQLGYLLVANYMPALIGVQVIRGFGFGSYTTASMTFTAERGSKESRGSNSGLFYMTASIGQLLGMFLGGQLAQFFGFTTLYLVCFGLALGSSVCFLALKRQTRRQAVTSVTG